MKLKCYVNETTGFEMAIEQLGYEIVDSDWTENYMYYTVEDTKIQHKTEKEELQLSKSEELIAQSLDGEELRCYLQLIKDQ